MKTWLEQGAPTTHYGTWQSPLGELVMGTNGKQLTGVWFDGQKDFPLNLEQWQLDQQHPVVAKTRTALERYFAGDVAAIDLPRLGVGLAPQGTAFERDVWEQLCHIRNGGLDQYGQIAKRLLKPQASRAVGRAVGLNPISIIIPCHRVVGSTRALTGYAGGMHRKRALLQLEGIATDDRKVLMSDDTASQQPSLL